MSNYPAATNPTDRSPNSTLELDSNSDDTNSINQVLSVDTEDDDDDVLLDNEPIIYNVVNPNNSNTICNQQHMINTNNNTTTSDVSDGEIIDDTTPTNTVIPNDIIDMQSYYQYLQLYQNTRHNLTTITPQQNQQLLQDMLNTAASGNSIDIKQQNTNNNTYFPFDTALSHTWRIPHFPLLRDRMATQHSINKKLLSDEFFVCNHNWQLMLFPCGNPSSNNSYTRPRHTSHASIFIHELSNTSPININFAICIVSNNNTQQSSIRDGSYLFQPGDDRGFNEFITQHQIDTQYLHEPDDSIIIQCLIEPVIEPQPKLHTQLNYNSKLYTGYVGLKNQGATCYMNSLLQSLYHIPQFRAAVYSMPIPPVADTEKSKKSISLALQRVFYQLQTSNSSVSTKQLTSSFGWDSLDAFMQHDVQEFSRVLIDSLEETIKKTQSNLDKHVINKLFEGQSESYIQCMNVDYKSSRIESFMDLAVNVKDCTDLYHSLDQYISEEKLTGDNQYRASEYGKQDAVKGVRFIALPNILQIQLKRFEYNPMTDSMIKLNDKFAFPSILDMSKYLDKSTIDSTDPSIYHLQSVLIHVGSVNGGHYYTYIRPLTKLSPAESPWIRFDDDQVYQVDESEAIEQSYGGEYVTPSKFVGMKQLHDQTRTRTASAYMLIYLKQSFCKWTEQSNQHVQDNDIKPVQSVTDVTAPVHGVATKDSKSDTIVNDGKQTTAENGTMNLPHTDQHINTAVLPALPLPNHSTHIHVAIPLHLQERFEHEAAEIARQREARALAHLYMRVCLIREPVGDRVGTEITMEQCDEHFQLRYIPYEMYINVRKDSTIESAAQQIQSAIHIDMQYQQYYTYEMRDNKTYRVNIEVHKNTLFASLEPISRSNETFLYVRDTRVDTKYQTHLYNGINNDVIVNDSNNEHDIEICNNIGPSSDNQATTTTPIISPSNTIHSNITTDQQFLQPPVQQQSADDPPVSAHNYVPPLPMPQSQSTHIPNAPPIDTKLQLQYQISPTYLLFKFFNVHTQSLHCLSSGLFASNLTMIQIKQYFRHVLRCNDLLPPATPLDTIPAYDKIHDMCCDDNDKLILDPYLQGKDSIYADALHNYCELIEACQLTELESRCLTDDVYRYPLDAYEETGSYHQKLSFLRDDGISRLYGVNENNPELNLISGDIIVMELQHSENEIELLHQQWAADKQHWYNKRNELLQQNKSNNSIHQSIDYNTIHPAKEKFCRTAREYYTYLTNRIVVEFRCIPYDMDEYGKPLDTIHTYHIELMKTYTLKQVYTILADYINSDSTKTHDIDPMRIRLHRHISDQFSTNKFGHCDMDTYINKSLDIRLLDILLRGYNDEPIFYYEQQAYSWIQLQTHRPMDIIFVDQDQQHNLTVLCPKQGTVSDLQVIAYQQYIQSIETNSSIRSSLINTTDNDTITNINNKRKPLDTVDSTPAVSPQIDDVSSKRRRVSPVTDSKPSIELVDDTDSDSKFDVDDVTNKFRVLCDRTVRTDIVLNIQHQLQPLDINLRQIWDLCKSTPGVRIRLELLDERSVELYEYEQQHGESNQIVEKLVWVVPFKKVNVFNVRHAQYKLLDLPFMIIIHYQDTIKRIIQKIADKLHYTAEQSNQLLLARLTGNILDYYDLYSETSDTNTSNSDDNNNNDKSIEQHHSDTIDEHKQHDRRELTLPWEDTYPYEFDDDDQPTNISQIIGFSDPLYKDRTGTMSSSRRSHQQPIKINT